MATGLQPAFTILNITPYVVHLLYMHIQSCTCLRWYAETTPLMTSSSMTATPTTLGRAWWPKCRREPRSLSYLREEEKEKEEEEEEQGREREREGGERERERRRSVGCGNKKYYSNTIVAVVTIATPHHLPPPNRQGHPPQPALPAASMRLSPRLHEHEGDS